MKVLLAVTAACLGFLILGEILPPAIGSSLLLAALAWLVVLMRQDFLHRRQMGRRRLELEARWAISIRHLNGLPLPIDTPATLFYSGDQIILETEQDQWSLARSSLLKALVITPENIRRINDQQLCRLLLVEKRIFTALREKIRHRDSTVRRSAIFILSFQDQPENKSVWVLIALSRPQVVANLLQASGLRDQGIVRIAHKRARRRGAAPRSSA